MGTIRYAKLDTSPRLQKLLMCLSDGKPKTTLEIIQATGLCAINTAIAELRANNIPVDCKAITTGVYSYRLAEFA